MTPLPYGAVEAWSTSLWELAVFGLLVLWGVDVLIRGQLRIGGGWMVWPLVGLLFIGLLQLMPLLPVSSVGRATITIDPFVTTQAVIRIAASIAFFLLASTFINTDQRRTVAVNTILVVCGLIALVGIGQSFIGKALWQRGTFGPFVNRNHFAGFMVMGVGLAGGLLIGRSVRRELLAVYGSALLLLGAGVLISASRGGALALAAEILFLALVALPMALTGARQHPGRGGLVLRSLGALLIAGASLAGALYLVGSEGLVRNLSQTVGEFEGSLPLDERYSRRDIWQATSQMISDNPWLGVGLGAFQFAYTRYDQSSGAQRVEQTHNDYLQVLADAGLVGAGLTLLFVGLFIVSALRAARTRHRRRRSIVLGALCGCFAIGIHSFVDFNLQVTANTQLFLTLLALATPVDDTEPQTLPQLGS